MRIGSLGEYASISNYLHSTHSNLPAMDLNVPSNLGCPQQIFHALPRQNQHAQLFHVLGFKHRDFQICGNAASSEVSRLR